jgi:hypothetical protein
MPPSQRTALLAALTKNRGELTPAALQQLLAKLKQA